MTEIEVRPVNDAHEMLVLMRALEDYSDDGERIRLARAEHGSATLAVPAGRHAEVVATLALRLARDVDGGVKVSEVSERHVVFEIGGAR